MKIIRFLRAGTFIVTLVTLLIFTGDTGANAANGQQVALIIGNGDYAVNPIATAVNDAQAITTSLKELGYEVFFRNNLDRERMFNTVNAFEKALAGAELGLFFYVGHGVQYQNANYLVPLGAQVESDWQIPEVCVALDDIMDTVARSGVKTAVFMVDAARPNPLGTRFSPPESGLAEMTAPGNLHIILADAPNHLTRQGVGPLPDTDSTSRFTATFLALLKEVPDLSIGQFMRQLQLAVAVKSRQDRNPWYRLGEDDSISLYDSQALFAKKLELWPKDSSLDQAQAFMAEALGPVADDQETDLRNPWVDNPILLLHTLLRDMEKLYDVEQMNLSESIYQASLAVLSAKYSHLMETDETEAALEILVQHYLEQMNLPKSIYKASLSLLKAKYHYQMKEEETAVESEALPQSDVSQINPPENTDQTDPVTQNAQAEHLVEKDEAPVAPETLLQSALTRTWPWPDPFLSPELAAKTAAAKVAKEAETLSDETDSDGEKADEKELDNKEEAESKLESLPEGESEPLGPLDTAPVVKINPAIAQLKASLILRRHKAMLKQSRLPEQIKRTALTAADDYARELEITAASPVTLLEKAMSIYHQQGRMALIISDGEIDQATVALIQSLETSGFTVTTTTLDLWQNEIVVLNEKLTVDDVGLIYVTSNRIPLTNLLETLAPSTSNLNIVIMDPALSSDTPEQPTESVGIPPENTVILLADTPTALKDPKEPLPDDTPPIIPSKGPLMAKALAGHLDKPGQTLIALFQKIRRNVTAVTKNYRTPWWIYGSDVIDTPFQFNDSSQKFTHFLAQLDIFRYLEATGAASELLDKSWKALVRDHPDWTWFVEKGDLTMVLKRAFATDSTDERHTIALKQGRLPRFTNERGMTFIYQPGGSFMMGSFPDEAGRTQDETIAETTINNGYYLMQTEVTQAQWQAVMGKNAASFSDCGPHCPIETVSWHDAKAFIKRLNGVDSSQTSVLPAAFQSRWREQFEQSTWHAFSSELDLYLRRVGNGDFFYRLPTEAQWEFACRSGRQTWFGFGSELWRLPQYAWYNENASRSTQPVATKRAHKNGFYDLHGNVWEWCQDGQGRFKIVRGGSWYYDALSARCAKRYYVKPTDANYNVGLRLVAVPVP